MDTKGIKFNYLKYFTSFDSFYNFIKCFLVKSPEKWPIIVYSLLKLLI